MPKETKSTEISKTIPNTLIDTNKKESIKDVIKGVETRKKDRVELTPSQNALFKKAFLDLIDARIQVHGLQYVVVVPDFSKSHLYGILKYYRAMQTILHANTAKNKEFLVYADSIYSRLRRDLGMNDNEFWEIKTNILLKNFIVRS